MPAPCRWTGRPGCAAACAAARGKRGSPLSELSWAGFASEVVELPLPALVVDEQPACGAHRAPGRNAGLRTPWRPPPPCLARARRLPPVSWRRGRRLRRRVFRAKGSTERPSRRKRSSGRCGLEDGGSQVDVADQRVARVRPLEHPRAADQQRHPSGGVVGEHLAQRNTVLALHEAVVGGEDDVGVVQHPLPSRARGQAAPPPRRPRAGTPCWLAHATCGSPRGARALSGTVPATQEPGLVGDVLLVVARRPHGSGASRKAPRWRGGGPDELVGLPLHEARLVVQEPRRAIDRKNGSSPAGGGRMKEEPLVGQHVGLVEARRLG